MFQTQEEITNMLRHAIRRCAGICRNLNSETYGRERGPDCARQIENEMEALVQETLALNKPSALKYGDVITWLASDEGKQSMAGALASANVTIKSLEAERVIDPLLLHKPFGMEHDPRN